MSSVLSLRDSLAAGYSISCKPEKLRLQLFLNLKTWQSGNAYKVHSRDCALTNATCMPIRPMFASRITYNAQCGGLSVQDGQVREGNRAILCIRGYLAAFYRPCCGWFDSDVFESLWSKHWWVQLKHCTCYTPSSLLWHLDCTVHWPWPPVLQRKYSYKL